MTNVTQKTDQDVLNELLLGMSVIMNGRGDVADLEYLSKAYQRIKSVQTASVNDLQQFFKATQGVV
ncbi:MAG: hypothetical protein RR959_08525 [Erysipelotrichaceae bacterium]